MLAVLPKNHPLAEEKAVSLDALTKEPPIYRKLAIQYKNKDSLPIASKYFIKYLLENIDRLP